MAELKIGDKVTHKSTSDFKMVVKDFDSSWPNDQQKRLAGTPNFEYPICSYYNIHTNQWEQEMFHFSELELDGE